MSTAPRYATLRDYVRVVRQQRWLIVAVAILFTGAALGWSVRQDTVYEAETSLLFKDENVDLSTFGVFTPSQSPEQRAAVSAQEIGRPQVVEAARRILRTDVESGRLAGAIAARPEARTHLVVVTARWGDAKFAARLADAFAEAARDVATDQLRRRYRETVRSQREALEALGKRPTDEFTRSLTRERIARLEAVADFVEPVEVARPAAVPSAPVEPRPVRNTVLGLLLGIMVGLLVAFGRDALDRRFKGSAEIREELSLPLLGFVRQETLGRPLVGGRNPLDERELEAFRIARTNVEFLDVDRPPKVLVVTSPLPEEGKSTVSAGLAYASAQTGARTLLIECDLRRPTLAGRLGIAPTPGLSDYLVGRAQPADVLQSIAVDAPLLNGTGAGPLVCIVAGTPSPQPGELLGSKRFAGLLEQVSEVYDTVILDSSPLLPVVDTRELLPRADAIVMCVRASQTTRDQARAAKSALDHLPARPMGVVVTGLRANEDGDYGYYSYSYAYGPAAAR